MSISIGPSSLSVVNEVADVTSQAKPRIAARYVNFGAGWAPPGAGGSGSNESVLLGRANLIQGPVGKLDSLRRPLKWSGLGSVGP